MSHAVIIAYRDSGDGFRQSALAYLLKRVWPGENVTVVDSAAAVFSRGESFNHGAEASAADVLVFTDADVVPEPDALARAIRMAAAFGVTAYPYDLYVRLSLDGTKRLYDDEPYDPTTAEWHEPQSVGGIFVCRRDRYLEAGGCDPRFVGWGFEDVAWSATSATLLGPHVRATGDLLHLWHPWDPHSGPAQRLGREQAIYEANAALCDRYTAAIGDTEAIRAIRAETLVAA